MEKLIFDIQDQLTEPFMKEIERHYFEHLKANEIPKGALGSPDSILKERVKKDMEEFKDQILGREELSLMENGFDLALKNLNKLPNADNIAKDLQEAGERFTSQEEPSNDEIPFFYETLLEMFGLSEETFDGFYTIASEFFNEGRYDEALSIFLILTNLSHLSFEPWLGQGICWQKRGNNLEAIRSFAMASLVNYEHPAPHLHTAEVYLSTGDKETARKILDLTLKECDKDLLKAYKDFDIYLKSKLKEK